MLDGPARYGPDPLKRLTLDGRPVSRNARPANPTSSSAWIRDDVKRTRDDVRICLTRRSDHPPESLSSPLTSLVINVLRRDIALYVLNVASSEGVEHPHQYFAWVARHDTEDTSPALAPLSAPAIIAACRSADSYGR